MIRHSGIHFTGLFAVHAIGFTSSIVIANYLGQSDFGQYSLLLFFAGLVSLLFKLMTKRGTYKQLFGGDDDDDDDDDDDEDLGVIEGREKILGNGIALTAILIGLVAVLMVPLGGPLSQLLLGTPDHKTLIFWAAAAGGFEGMWNLTSNVVRLERRPVSYVILSAVRPILILAIVLAVVIEGGGPDGRDRGDRDRDGRGGRGLAGHDPQQLPPRLRARDRALDRRQGLRPHPDPGLVLDRRPRRQVHRLALRQPLRPRDLLARLADELGDGVGPGGVLQGVAAAEALDDVRRGRRPLRRRGRARRDADLLRARLHLGPARRRDVRRPAVIRVAPSFEDAAPLIPLLAAGAIAPYLLRGVNKAASMPNKRKKYIAAGLELGDHLRRRSASSSSRRSACPARRWR